MNEICHECEINGRVNCSEHGYWARVELLTAEFSEEHKDLHADGWISIKQRLPCGAPESKWLCFFNYVDSNAVASQTLSQIIKAGIESRLTHWMPIPDPPKAPVDEGEKLANQYASGLSSSRDRDCAVRDYMAGYAAGKKSKPSP